MVEVQCPAETFATPNRSACDRIAPPSIDQLIPEPLVIALQMIVRSVLVHCLPQVPFAQWDYLRQTFRLDRADESLRVRIQIRTARR
jgi:hypothetical protein